MGFLDGSMGEESTYNAGDTGDVGLMPEFPRFPGGRNGNPLHSCLKNPMDRGAWWATVYRVVKRDTAERLSTEQVLS